MWGGGRQEREFFVFAGNANVVFGQNFNKKFHKIVGNCLHGRVKKKDISTHPTGMHSCLLPPANEVCEGYVFTGVCLSTGQVPPRQVHPRAGTPLGKVHPPGRYIPQAGTPPNRYTHPTPGRYNPPWQVHTPGKVHPLEGSPPTPVHAGIQSTSRRYVSHWNAFLFIN